MFIVWAISGLWHGANWTFVCWGLFHATLLVIYNLLGINTKYKNVVAHGRLVPSFREFLQLALTFVLAVIGWIIFRSEDMSQAFGFISRMVLTFFSDFHPVSILGKRELLMGLAVLLVEWVQREKQHGLQLSGHGLMKYRLARYALYACLIVVMFFWAGQVQTFIYFQF